MKNLQRILGTVFLAFVLLCARAQTTATAPAIPGIDPTPILATRNIHPAFTAVEMPDPSDIGQTVTYPTATLFGALGPVETDGYQYGWGNCGVWSTIKGFVRQHPDVVQTMMVTLPNGRIAVRVHDGNFGGRSQDHWISITPKISTNQCGLSANNCIWAQELEKVFAIVVGNGTFAGTAGENPNPIFGVFGLWEESYGDMPDGHYFPGQFPWFKSEGELATALTKLRANKETWIVGTGGSNKCGADIILDHWYSVRGLTSDGLVDLSNPWGPFYDRKITKAQFLEQFTPSVSYGVLK